MVSEPSRPEGPLVFSDVDASSVHLSWKPPLDDNGGVILGYLIEAKDVLHMDVRKTYVWSEGTECTVQDLETSHIYQFRVYAQNEAGRSEGLLNKSLVRIKAKSKKPPKPSKPIVEIYGDDSVVLKWTVPESSENLNYVIERYEPKNDLWMQCNREMVTTTSHMVTNLSRDKEYKFRVSSENATGVSLPSEPTELVKWKAVEEEFGEPPSIIVSLKDCFVKSNDSALFSCEYKGTPPIHVKWTKDEIRIREGLCSVTQTDDSGKSELLLKEVDSDDDDCVVQCSAQNSFGMVTSEAAIRIFSLPKLGYPSSYKDGLTFDSGDTLRLRVTIFGKPPPSVKWFFNDSESPLNDRISIAQLPESMEIRIQDLSAKDSGRYKIVAYNVMGEDSIDVEVSITGPPDPPEGPLTFEVVEDNEIILKWNTPLRDGGSEIFSYVVEMKKVGDEIWSRFGSTHKTSISLGDIDDIEGSTYRIRATNIYGTSGTSTEICFLNAHMNIRLETMPLEQIQLSKCSDQHEEKPHGLASEFPNSTDIFSQQTTESIKQDAVTNIEEIESDRCEKDESVTINDEGNNNFDDITPALIDFINEVFPFVICLSRNWSQFSNEVSNFACERLLQFDHSVPVLECEKFCVVGSTVMILESINSLSESEFFEDKCFYLWTPRESSIEIRETFCYVPFSYWTDTLDLTSECISLIKEKNLIWTFDVPQEEKHSIYLDEFSFISISSEITQDTKRAIIVFWPPLLLEKVTSHEIHVPQKHFCRTSFNYFESLFVSLSSSLETSCDFHLNVMKPSETAILRTDSSEDFEGLISVCSVPIRTWKPAMSVLPIRRHIQVVDNLQESVLPKKTDYPIENIQGTCFGDSFQTEILGSIDELGLFLEDPKEILFDSTLKREQDIEFLFKTDDESSSSIRSGPKGAEKTKFLPNTLEETSKISPVSNVTYPSWLCRVSPYFVSSSESTEQETGTCDSVATEEEIEEVKPVKADICKYRLKEKSVQELLQLAEEVQLSFNQKAEQIESLECILQEELFSLEKDLKVVNEIHKGLNDSHDSYFYDQLKEDSLLDVSASEEENLIEFTEDVPSISPGNGTSSEYQPEVIVHLQNRIVQSGCRTRLYCSIMGDPDPEIKWLKNGKYFPQSSRYLFSNLVEFGLYMDIFNAKSTDSGQYTCIATNRHGSAQTQAYLQVIGDREVSPEEPKFLRSPDDLSCHPGESVVLEWKTSGTPTPHVMWFKNAGKIETDLRTDIFSNHRGCCRLALHNVNINDSAIYTCYLENDAGSAVSTVMLTVTDTKDSSNFQGSFEGQLLACEEICVLENQMDDLQTSYSSPEKHADLLSEDEKFFNADIWKASGGKYIETKKSENPPGSPIAPHVLSSGQTWTILTWSSPMERRGRFEYLIERRLINTDHWTEVGRTFNTLYTVQGLKKGRSYVFRISAGNSRGWSLPSILPQPIHAPPR
ncbi:titin [Nephila pilipes]|uniref:Titin n=1 Tax=Nephila pilipes TaxID=299642 RepID=A0A8X6U0P6_NEPPI|nr:titin [Nephila pilipes]